MSEDGRSQTTQQSHMFPERHWKKLMLHAFTSEDDFKIKAPVSDVTINALSDPVLLEIIKYLNIEDKFRLAGVCRRFNSLVKDKYLWMHVDLCCCSYSLNGRTLHRLLNRYILSRKLRSLNLPRRFVTNAVFRKLGEQCPSLEELSLTQVTLSRKLSFTVLPDSLRLVSFNECNMARSPTNLQANDEISLNLRRVRFFGYKCRHKLRSCLWFLKNVEELVVDDCDCYNSTLCVRRISERNPTITSMSLCNLTDLTDDAIEEISRYVPNLTALTLRGNIALTEGCFEHIKNMKNLKSIDVGDNPQFDNETLNQFVLEYSKFNR